jgi:hypothetical protein
MRGGTGRARASQQCRCGCEARRVRVARRGGGRRAQHLDLVRHGPCRPLHPVHHLLLLLRIGHGRKLPELLLRPLLRCLQRPQLARTVCYLRARPVVALRAQPDEGVPPAPEPLRAHLRKQLSPAPADMRVRQLCGSGACLPLVGGRQVLVVADAVESRSTTRAAASGRSRERVPPRLGQHDECAQHCACGHQRGGACAQPRHHPSHDLSTAQQCCNRF